MKKLFFFLAICSGLLFAACGDDDDNTPEEFITAEIDGAAFEAVTITAIVDNTLGEPIVFATGVNADASFTIGMNIPVSTAEGTTATIDELDLALTFTDAAENTFFTVGEFKLDTNDTDDNVMEGTFSFTATDSDDPTNVIEVSNGEFRIMY